MTTPEPTKYHQQLREIFVSAATDFISVFSRIITHSNEMSIISRAMIIILSGTTSLLPVLEWSIKSEFDDAETPSDLFKGGLPAVLLSEYSKNFAVPFIEVTIGKCLRETSDQHKKRVLEVNPNNSPDHQENADKLRDLVDLILNTICTSADIFPVDFRLLFISLANFSKEKFPTEYYQIVASVFFQMFILPPIVDPEAYSLKDSNLPRGTVIYLSKLLQHVVQKSTCSTYMSKFSEFVENVQPRITKFITKLLKPPTAAMKTSLSIPTCTPDSTLLALSCLQYYIYWYLQDFTSDDKMLDHPFSKVQSLMQEWELSDGKPDPIDEKDLRIDYMYPPKTARGTRQGFFKRKKTNTLNLTHPFGAHLTSKHQTHLQNLEESNSKTITKQLVEESAEESDKVSGEDSSAADSEYSLSETADEARFHKISEGSGTQTLRAKKRSTEYYYYHCATNPRKKNCGI